MLKDSDLGFRSEIQNVYLCFIKNAPKLYINYKIRNKIVNRDEREKKT